MSGAESVMISLSRIIAVCLGGVALLLDGNSLAASSGVTNSESACVTDLFAGRVVLRLQIQIPPAGIRQLSANESGRNRRPSALAIVKEGAHVYTNVELHLKGGAGSFRPIDDDPGLTLNFEKAAPGQSFHGLKKFSLNNSVQDPSFLNEKLCRELFNSAGNPAPRAGFATVHLNGRDLGIHVLTEGFNKQFLRQYFEDVRGNLYQTHGNQEITDRLDVNSGDDPKNDAGLRSLAGAVNEQDPAARWNRLQQTLDVNRFVTFMALEVMLCHWDGYCMNQNNYRIFHDLKENKMVFIPHGMDQMFGAGTMRGQRGGANCPIYPPMEGAVANAVLSTPVGRRLYIARVGDLYTNLFKLDLLLKRVDELSSVVRMSMTESAPRFVKDYQVEVDSLKAQIVKRNDSLTRQLADLSKPRDPRFSKPVHLEGWAKRVQEGRPEFDITTQGSRTNLLHISAAHRQSSSSWRTRARLAPGRYRFEGELRVQGVVPKGEGGGAGLRISGSRPLPEISGAGDWRPFCYEFQVGENNEVEFICELRALDGEAWFDKLMVVPCD
jgi:spore coat protein CotH